MPTIEAIVRKINRDLVPEFEKKLRAYLADQDKDWLIEQIVRLTLDAHSREEMDRRQAHEEQARKRQERAERVKKLQLDRNLLEEFIQKHQNTDRDKLIAETYLSQDVPAKGKELVAEQFHTPEGNQLLQHAKDVLFGLLFGDENMDTNFHRIQRQLLTLVLPSTKSEVLDFMSAKTELKATGTWQDPEHGDKEMQADNVVLEIEYGETEDQMIGKGIITALRLINDLEINEEILYGRMEKVERSTLIS